MNKEIAVTGKLLQVGRSLLGGYSEIELEIGEHGTTFFFLVTDDYAKQMAAYLYAIVTLTVSNPSLHGGFHRPARVVERDSEQA